MKNVLKRLIELINLFGDDTKISTNKIKDSIPDYRDLNEQAFRRAFERDKSLLRSFGYLIEYSNDKWSHDESGYTMGGSYVFNNIKKNEDINMNSFVNTYLLLKKNISLQGNLHIYYLLLHLLVWLSYFLLENAYQKDKFHRLRIMTQISYLLNQE